MPFFDATFSYAKRAAVFVCLASGAASAAVPATAQSSLDLDSLLDALSRPAPPAALTRSIGAAPIITGPTEAEATFLQTLPTRGLTIEARAEVAVIAADRALPRIDLDIPFDYDSDGLRSDIMVDLVTIGRALSSEDLAHSRFILAGHTDGVGSAPYNQDLSERRASAVRAFLIEAFNLPPQQLIAVGFGFEQLSDTLNPAAAENRRVEVINLEVGWE